MKGKEEVVEGVGAGSVIGVMGEMTDVTDVGQEVDLRKGKGTRGTARDQGLKVGKGTETRARGIETRHLLLVSLPRM